MRFPHFKRTPTTFRNSKTRQQSRSQTPKKVNRAVGVCYHSKFKSEDVPIVHSLFSNSKSAERKCCSQPEQSTVDNQIQSLSDTIDSKLLDMATEGYVLPAAESEITEILSEIRRTGRLKAAPWDGQPWLAINCVIPKPSVDNKVSSSKEAVPKVAPSAAWARLGSAKYDFVDGRK